MKKKIINGLLFAVAMVAATSSFVSCKDYDADNYNELQAKYLSLQDAFNKQVAAMQDYVLTSRYNAETGYSAAELEAKGTIKKRLDDLEKDTASLAKRISDNNLAIKKAQALAERDSARLHKLVAAWGKDLDYAIGKAAEVLATVANDSTKWNETSETVKNRKAEWDRAVQVADKAWAFVDNTTTKDGKKIESLQDLVDAYEGADEALKEDIAALKQDVANVLKLIQQQVTGIEIQATYNPIFGTFSYPIGVQSNILGAYYGVAGGYVKFPAGDRTPAQIASWATQAPAITSDELDELVDPKDYLVYDKNDTLMLEGAGNAGKLYLTVNPSDVDMTGKEFTLRASDNTVSKVALSELKACTEQLKWGYNRAASANGFYVATAEIKKESVKDVALSFNLKGLAKQIQSMMSDWSKTSASDIAKLALTIHDGMKTNVPRLGVQAQWKDTLGWKNYVSKYDVAAFSVKPLGFDFLLTKDEDGNVVPMDFSQGIVKFKNKLTAKEKAVSAELINKIAKLVAFKLNLGAITQENIEITPDGKIYVIVSSATKPLTLTIAAGSIDAGWNIPSTSKELTITDDNKINITPLFDEINKAIQTKLAEVQNEANGAVNKVLNKIIDIENRIFGKLESVAKNPNRYLQPALIGSCNQFNGYFYPSRDYLAPTQIKKGQKIMLYPTTLTGEIVAPAFKKYVAISGVWKVSDINSTDNAKAANDAVNAAADKKCLNTVFDGAEFNIQNGLVINTGELKAGYVYEFIYECLGYNGMVAGKKYYIEVYE